MTDEPPEMNHRIVERTELPPDRDLRSLLADLRPETVEFVCVFPNASREDPLAWVGRVLFVKSRGFQVSVVFEERDLRSEDDDWGREEALEALSGAGVDVSRSEWMVFPL